MVLPTVGSLRAHHAEPLVTDLRAVRWAAMVFLVADSTDVLVGLLAPGHGLHSSPMDLVQTAVGLVACGCLVWAKWRGAVSAIAVLVVMLVVREPVGIEFSVLVVAAAVLAVALPVRLLPMWLAAGLGLACALGYLLNRGEPRWWPPTLVLAGVVTLVTATGAVGGRLLREREASHRALQRLQADNVRIRAEERQALANELQQILTRGFRSMRTSVQQAGRGLDPSIMHRIIDEVGGRSRSTMASVRVALQTLRAETSTDPMPVRTPAWIDALQSAVVRGAISRLSIGTAVLSAGFAGWQGGEMPGVLLAGAVGVASPLTLAVALWREPAGLALALAVLGVDLVTPGPTMWSVLPVLVLCFVAGRHGRSGWIAATVALHLVWIVVVLVQDGRETHLVVGVMEAAVIAGILLGLTVNHFEITRNLTRADYEHLHSEQNRIVADERAAVARELHDVVGHQLSLVSMQALAAESERDPVVLAGRLDRIEVALAAGERDIGELVGMLNSIPGEAASDLPVPPTAVASQLSRELRDHNYDAEFSIDAGVDGLEPTTQRTIARILQESGTNVLRHTPHGGACSFAVAIEESALTFVARSPLPETKAESLLAGGHGLRGIRERVELTGGTFFAGSRDGAWEVRVRIPAPRSPSFD